MIPSRPRRLLMGLICGAVLGYGMPSRADESTDPSPDPSTDQAELPAIYETATVEARPLSNATASVTVIEREQIRSLDATTVADVIPHIPGLFLSHNGPRGGTATAQIRGGDPNFTIVLLDGVPFNDSTDQFGGAVNLNSIPANQVERIEVVRGPVSSLYGSSAMSGAINIITRRGSAKEPAWHAEVAAGDNAFGQAAASLSERTDRGDFYVGLLWEQTEGQIGDDRFEQYGVQGNVHRDFGEQTKFGLTGRVTHWEGDDYREGSGGPIYGSGETRRSDHDELSLGADMELGPSERRHRIYLTLYRHDLERTSPAIGFVIPESIESTEYSELRLGWNWPALAKQKTRFNIGAELDYQDGTNESVLVGFASGDYSLDRVIGAGYVEFLAESGPVLIELGARVDVPEEFDTELSPRFGIRYRFADGGVLRGSIARAFKLPSFYALASPPQLGGNPDLAAETSLGGDLGAEYSFGASGVTAGLTLFSYRYDDLIDFDFATFMLVNRSRVDTNGAELFVNWKASERIDLQANVTRQDVEDVTAGVPLRGRPDWISAARFNWAATARLGWEVDGQWASGSRDQQIPVPDLDSVDGYQLYGTALRYTLGARWSLHARAENLLDEEYETMIGFPGPPRQFKVGARFRSR